MLINTLDISKKRVDTVFQKIGDNDALISDKRGRSKKRPRAFDENKKQSVREHINLFPREDSHYGRNDSSREYLESSLSLRKMFRLYIDWAKEMN